MVWTYITSSFRGRLSGFTFASLAWCTAEEQQFRGEERWGKKKRRIGVKGIEGNRRAGRRKMGDDCKLTENASLDPSKLSIAVSFISILILPYVVFYSLCLLSLLPFFLELIQLLAPSCHQNASFKAIDDLCVATPNDQFLVFILLASWFSVHHPCFLKHF